MIHPLSAFKPVNLIMLFLIVPSIFWFRETLEAISKFYSFISVQDIEHYYYGDKKLNSCCHICFDDGDRTVYENAFPVLKSMILMDIKQVIKSLKSANKEIEIPKLNMNISQLIELHKSNIKLSFE